MAKGEAQGVVGQRDGGEAGEAVGSAREREGAEFLQPAILPSWRKKRHRTRVRKKGGKGEGKRGRDVRQGVACVASRVRLCRKRERERGRE